MSRNPNRKQKGKMIITSLLQLTEHNRKLTDLEWQGMTACDEYIGLKRYTVSLDPILVEKETNGAWRWLMLHYDWRCKFDFVFKIKELQDKGVMCVLPPNGMDCQYNRYRVSTNLSDDEIHMHFDKYDGGLMVITVINKDNTANNWWLE